MSQFRSGRDGLHWKRAIRFTLHLKIPWRQSSSVNIHSHARRLLSYHAGFALILALIVAGVAWTWNTRVASGSDAYGYVSQAELWLHGNLQIDQSFAAEAPWPLAGYTFSALGYRPTGDGNHLVPNYPPGLPLMMAAAKAVVGQCGLFQVVPILAGVLVFATYVIGRQIGRPLVGLAAAWIVATSPTFLFSSMWPMSDVPAAAAWAVAVAFLVSETRRDALFAGLTACLAVLVRPIWCRSLRSSPHGSVGATSPPRAGGTVGESVCHGSCLVSRSE